MRFALKLIDQEPMFLSAYYASTGETFWTVNIADACSYSSFYKAIVAKNDVLIRTAKSLEIISVVF